MTKFDTHFQPRANVLIERNKFISAKQEPEESIDSYLVKITGLVQQCGFAADSVNEHLRDQLVYGCHDERLREKLFRKAELTFDQAKAHEAAREQMMIFNHANRTSSNKKVVAQVVRSSSGPQNPSKGSNKNCFRCGRNQLASKRPFKEAV